MFNLSIFIQLLYCNFKKKKKLAPPRRYPIGQKVFQLVSNHVFQNKNHIFINLTSPVWNNVGMKLLWIVHPILMEVTIPIGRPKWNFFLHMRRKMVWNVVKYGWGPQLKLDMIRISTGKLKSKQEWDKLMTTNYSLWKSMMEDLLNCKYLYDPIEGDKAKPSEMLNLD